MNKELSENIAYHILAGFGILPSSFINKTLSLKDKKFLLTEKLSFISDEKPLSKNIYGCQIDTPDGKSFKVLLGDCTWDKNLPEYCLVVHLEDSPAYGIYLVFNKNSKESVDSEVLISFSVDLKSWVICTTYLQATFLAGMERIKDLGYDWKTCQSYKDEHQLLVSYIKFHNAYFDEEDYEG